MAFISPPKRDLLGGWIDFHPTAAPSEHSQSSIKTQGIFEGFSKTSSPLQAPPECCFSGHVGNVPDQALEKDRRCFSMSSPSVWGCPEGPWLLGKHLWGGAGLSRAQPVRGLGHAKNQPGAPCGIKTWENERREGDDILRAALKGQLPKRGGGHGGAGVELSFAWRIPQHSRPR